MQATQKKSGKIFFRRSFFDDFLSLLFPRTCEICGNSLYKNETLFCTHCLGRLPYTNWHRDPENPLHAVFWGKVPVKGVAAMLYFHHGNKVQTLLHKFKYKGVREIGHFIGKRYGYQLRTQEPFTEIDAIIPIPLHPHKQKKRGYNQSEVFARGLAEAMKVPVFTDVLIRKIASETQTRKTKIQRWENVKDIFEVVNGEKIIGKHLLVVDDVITTGSTLEASINLLLEHSGVQVSVAAIAAAHR